MNMKQIPLFDDEYVLINDAVAALKALRPDDALDFLQRCRDLYRGGKDIEMKLQIASFLSRGLSAAPPVAPDLPRYLFQLWRSFESFRRSLGADGITAQELQRPFFQKIVAAIDESHLGDADFLAEGIPIGFAYLKTEEYDRAIRSLQACLAATPDKGRIYGYLADAYLMRGDREVARQVYFEACLIDPLALDWNHLQDTELQDRLEWIQEEYGFEPSLARAWLPACAYVRGLFKPKQIRRWEDFKAFVNGYLELKKTALKAPSPLLEAKLFLNGLVLCDNEPFLRMFKGIDFAEVRREMKAANPIIFAEYLKHIGRLRRPGR
jgi:tetratricopeptide (TPR) repeat protein